MRVRSALCGACLLALLASPELRAAPPEHGNDTLASEHVLPPGREDALRELLDAVTRETPAERRWLGPSIELDRVKWWLMRGDRADAMLLLLPRELAETDDAISVSFAIRVAWPPEQDIDPAARELMRAAIDAVQSGDHGQFYVAREQAPQTHPEPEPEPEPPPPYVIAEASDRDALRRRWLLEFGAVLTLALLAFAAVVRPSGRPA